MTNHDRTAVLETPIESFVPSEAELAAEAFVARYSGRALDAYRHDLRNLFQWAADHSLAVLEATRAHLELYRTSMEDRGPAASAIDRRLSTACGFYRFAHIDGRIPSNPAQYVRRPRRCTRQNVVASIAVSWGGFSSRGALRPRSRGPRRAAGPERPARQRGL
jgi:site-specific recombinase XerC